MTAMTIVAIIVIEAPLILLILFMMSVCGMIPVNRIKPAPILRNGFVYSLWSPKDN